MNKPIFIVEDEFIVAEDLQFIVEKEGYTVCGIADNVEDGYNDIKKTKPAMVLLDIHLKGQLNGIELAHRLKQEGIAFVFISANSNQRILEKAKLAEPYGFLVKPFREQDLLVMLDIAFYRHENSLEAMWRKEKELQKLLQIIQSEVLPPEQKLLNTARAIQKSIPFDCIYFKIRTGYSNEFIQISFRRVGFDEYQLLGIPELITISGIDKDQITVALDNNPLSAEPAIFNAVDFEKTTIPGSLTFLMSELFSVSSALSYPFVTAGVSSGIMILFQRHDGEFKPDHLQLLSAVHMAFIGVFESMGQRGLKIKSASGYNIDRVFREMIGNSPCWLTVLDLVNQVSVVDTSVLLLGESGTGKEKIANCIHLLSERKNKPFIKINCAAIPPTLFESELFGHEKGAFTNAIEKRIGKFELANEGTIFLDEIGDMPLEMQVKLLRVLQEKEIERIGGKQPIKIDVRIIAATNRNLQAEMASGKFRLDLYYRLNVFPITLPTLRDRREDIPLLADYIAHSLSRKFNKPYWGISDEMMKQLLEYDFPGNIRELENMFEQAVILNDGKSPLSVRGPIKADYTQISGNTQDEIKTIDDIKKLQKQTEIAYITTVLKKTKGRIRGKDGAAELLNEKPTTLESRILKLGIRKEDFY